MVAVALLSGCTALNQVGSAYNFTKCTYSYKSITGLSVGGMDISGGISLLQTPQILALLGGAGKSVPINFTLNLNVDNPTASAAAMSGVHYALDIDGVEFTTGSVNRAINIPAGGRNVLPLSIGVDIMKLLQGESASAATKALKNFIGIGSEKSNVSLRIKPVFNVAGVAVESPAYIPVNFSFGGK